MHCPPSQYWHQAQLRRMHKMCWLSDQEKYLQFNYFRNVNNVHTDNAAKSLSITRPDNFNSHYLQQRLQTNSPKNPPESQNCTAGLTANEELSVINLDKKSITKCELILSAKINLCIPVRLHIKITGEMIYWTHTQPHLQRRG